MNSETSARHVGRRAYVRLVCVVLVVFLEARCTTYQPVRPAAPQVNDSVAVGSVRVTKKSGQAIHLESAFLRGDSIIGNANAVVGVPLDSVRSIDQRRVDVMSSVRVLQLGAAILLLIGMIQFFGGGGACC